MLEQPLDGALDAIATAEKRKVILEKKKSAFTEARVKQSAEN